MYILINHNLIHNDHTHNLFHDQNHLHPAIVVDKQNGGKTAQKAEKGDAVFDQNGKNGYFKNHNDVDYDPQAIQACMVDDYHEDGGDVDDHDDNFERAA